MTEKKQPLFRRDVARQPATLLDEPFELGKFRAFALLPAFWLLFFFVVGAFGWLLTRQTAVFTATQAYYLEPDAVEPVLAVALPAEQLVGYTVNQTATLRLENAQQQWATSIKQILPASNGNIAESDQWQNLLPALPGKGYLIVAMPPHWSTSPSSPISLQISTGPKTLFQILFLPD